MERSDGLSVCGDGTERSDVGVHGEQVKEAVGEVVVELAVPSGEARSFGPGECDMTSAAATAVAKPVVDARPFGIAKHCPDRISVSGEARFSWSGAGGVTSTAEMTEVAKPVVEARPAGFAKNSASTESVCVVSPGEAGSSWSKTGGTEGPRVGVCGDGTEGSRVGAFGDGTEGSRDGVCGDGTEGSRVGVFGDGAEGSCVRVSGDGAERSPAVAKSVGEARPPAGAEPLVLRAVERLLDMWHEPALRCLERLRRRIEQVEKEGSPS